VPPGQAGWPGTPLSLYPRTLKSWRWQTRLCQAVRPLRSNGTTPPSVTTFRRPTPRHGDGGPSCGVRPLLDSISESADLRRGPQPPNVGRSPIQARREGWTVSAVAVDYYAAEFRAHRAGILTSWTLEKAYTSQGRAPGAFLTELVLVAQPAEPQPVRAHVLAGWVIGHVLGMALLGLGVHRLRGAGRGRRDASRQIAVLGVALALPAMAFTTVFPLEYLVRPDADLLFPAIPTWVAYMSYGFRPAAFFGFPALLISLLVAIIGPRPNAPAATASSSF